MKKTTTDKIIGRQPKAWTLWGITLGLILIVAGTLMPLMGNVDTYRWIYGAGALLLLISRIFSPYTGEEMRIKRLYRIESWSALFFCVAVFFMFYEHGTMRDWLGFTMAGGAIQVYTSIMIPYVMRKINREGA